MTHGARHWCLIACLAAELAAVAPAAGQPFQLPTANRALLERGGADRFFVGTVGKPWTTGTFGCVRSNGGQMHEGVDIRCVQRDNRGEPTDPVLATSDGRVAYINRRPSLSNYGSYIILRHQIEGIEIYSLYAHLKEVRRDLKVGQTVKGGEAIGIMGRTANTREGISKERAHVHFELDLLASELFSNWYKRHYPGQRNDHGTWNGQNLLALDPGQLFLEQQRKGAKFSLVEFIRSQTELCRVLVLKKDFPWLKSCAPLARRNPIAEKEGIAGYELALNFNGLVFEFIPRAASEIKSKSKIQLLRVNEAEYERNPCRRLVTKRKNQWELTTKGKDLIELLTY